MSKNILKKAQEKRKEGQSEEERAEERDPLRKALLDGEARDEQPTKRLNAEIPTHLHKRFKAACQSEGVSMTDALTQLLETYVELRNE